MEQALEPERKMRKDALQATEEALHDHKGVLDEESSRLYRTRAFALIGNLADRHSDSGMNGYCLDALDELPAGGMVADAMAGNPQWRTWPRAIRFQRGVSLQEACPSGKSA
jgi:hypothetical protein